MSWIVKGFSAAWRRSLAAAMVALLMCGLLGAQLLNGQDPPQQPPKPADQTQPKPADPQPPAKKPPQAPSKRGSGLSKEEADAAAKILQDPNSQPEYKIGVGDGLNIVVWREPEVSGSVTVRGDCRITLQLVKELEVCGMTPTEIQALLTDKLGKFIAAPDVTVSLTSMSSRKVFFVGGFKRQGGMVLNGPMTIAQALSDAGGLGEFVNGKKVVIRRPQKTGPPKEFIFNYNDFLKGKATTENILLEPGDTIIVK